MDSLLVTSIIFVSFVIAMYFASILDNNDDFRNAEFEAEHCPKMLNVESKYCQPSNER